jgi:hypothetical protein
MKKFLLVTTAAIALGAAGRCRGCSGTTLYEGASNARSDL